MTSSIIIKGARKPLLFTRHLFKPRLAVLLLTSFFLIGCQSVRDKPILYATGYSSPDGVTRIWRKDLAGETTSVVSDYFPFRKHKLRERAVYEYVNGSLSLIRREVNQVGSLDSISEQLRFDAKNKTTFNQRVYPRYKERISALEIGLLRSHAEEVKGQSDALIAAGVRLIQGRYDGQQVVPCGETKPISVSLAYPQRVELNAFTQIAPQTYIAWVSSALSDNLILISQHNLCQDAPEVDALY